MSKLKKVLPVLSAVFLIVGVVAVAFGAVGNARLKEDFSPRENVYDYAQALADHEIDLERLPSAFPEASPLNSMRGFPRVDVPLSVRYYKNIGDDTPAYVMEKGTLVNIGYLGRENQYRGLLSLPTDVPGWRLAKPFDTGGAYMLEELYYVRLSDLQRVATQWLVQLPEIKSWMPIASEGKLPFTQTCVEYVTLYIDRFLYDEGIYLSPDLYQPLFPVWVCISFALALACGALWFVLKKRARSPARQKNTAPRSVAQ